MALADVDDAAAVRAAMAEFDAVGREAFLQKYGFKPARDYFIVDRGQRYDSKAVVGAAHQVQHGVQLTAGDFSGGDATVARRLERLGFTVTHPVSLPDWSRDELLLALHLYLSTRHTKGYGKSTREVIQLSEELRILPIFPVAVRSSPKFRNPSGVALKIHNFESIDPTHTGKGMPHVGRGDVQVWEEWHSRPVELAAVVEAIRRTATSGLVDTETDEDEEHVADEGRILYRHHRAYERDRGLAERKKRDALRRTGRIACEVCGFASRETYGESVGDVIDVHHIRPLHEVGETRSGLADLALVCPTCHRVLHKHTPLITPAELHARRAAADLDQRR